MVRVEQTVVHVCACAVPGHAAAHTSGYILAKNILIRWPLLRVFHSYLVGIEKQLRHRLPDQGTHLRWD